MHKVQVIGIGFRPLERAAHAALVSSDVVLTNNRLLDVFRSYEEYSQVKQRLLVHKSVYEMLDYIAENYPAKKLSILGAGDPMFFGIGRMIVERCGRDAVEVYPDLSSLQVAFSRIRETSNNALLISLHGGPDPEKRRRLEYDLSDLPGLIARYDKIGILTDRENNPSVIAAALTSSIDSSHLSIVVYVCEKIGYTDEKIMSGTPDEIAGMSFEHPNVVVLKRTEQRAKNNEHGKKNIGDREIGELSPATAIRFGLMENEIIHAKGLITKDEIRAVTIHKLKLPDKGVLWDIGAGSGSVSIESAKLLPSLKVYAVEREKERADMIRQNIKMHRTASVEVIDGPAPGALVSLPVPDRVFIGGSGGSMGDIIKLTGNKMTAGIVVINASTIETLHEAVSTMEENGFVTDISEVSVSRSKGLAGKRHMSALNPVFIVRGEMRVKGQVDPNE